MSSDLSPPGLLHVTHWKAGSQWIREILQRLFPDRIVAPEVGESQFLQRPLQPQGVYPTLYLSRWQFESVPAGREFRRFVVVRDLRDTLVSMYFSFRNVHPILTPQQEAIRAVLQALPIESGLVYLTERVLEPCALIQRSWFEAGEPLFRYEDLLGDDIGELRRMLVLHGGQPVDEASLRRVAQECRFEARTGGRKRGLEDRTAHERKGVAGDWREHFTPRLRQAFGTRYGELVALLGYEQDPQWWREPQPALG